MERNEELTGDEVLKELRDIRKALATVALFLLVIAGLLAAIVFGTAELVVKPA